MTAPIETPGAGTPQEPGAAATPGTPSGDPTNAAGTPGTPESDPGTSTPAEPGNYEAKIRADPEFAVSQVKAADTRVNRANDEVKKIRERYSALDPVVEQLGGAGRLMSELQDYAVLVSNPGMNRIIQQFKTTGRVPTEDDFGYEGDTPEESTVAAAEVQAIKTEMARLQAQLNGQAVKTGKDTIVSFLKETAETYPDHFETLIRPALEEQFESWEHDPAGRQLLQNISRPQLEQALGGVLYQTGALTEIGKAAYLREQRAKAGAATDAPSGTLTSAAEVPAGERHANSRDAFAEFDRQTRAGLR